MDAQLRGPCFNPDPNFIARSQLTDFVRYCERETARRFMTFRLRISDYSGECSYAGLLSPTRVKPNLFVLATLVKTHCFFPTSTLKP